MLNYFNQALPIGESERFNHTSDTCSGDSESLVVTRIAGGWQYYCHRCGWQGIHRGKSSPSETKAALNLQLQNDDGKFWLPPQLSSQLPSAATLWLSKYGITEQEIKRYGIKYSHYLNRLILPVYDDKGEMVYWQGRNLGAITEENSKYLNLSVPGKDVFFTCNTGQQIVVLVEDILSAIKVGRVAGSIALLGSYVAHSVASMLKGKKVVVWLDDDKYVEAIKYAAKLRAVHNIDAVNLRTMKDPKEYDEKQIRGYLSGVIGSTAYKVLSATN